jgi:hypothetical protein
MFDYGTWHNGEYKEIELTSNMIFGAETSVFTPGFRPSNDQKTVGLASGRLGIQPKTQSWWTWDDLGLLWSILDWFCCSSLKGSEDLPTACWIHPGTFPIREEAVRSIGLVEEARMEGTAILLGKFGGFFVLLHCGINNRNIWIHMAST